MNIPFYRHNIGDEEKTNLIGTLNSLFLGMGPKVKEFEAKFSSYLNVKNVIATSNCTDSLALILRSLGVGKGDQVITTPLTFIASSNAILSVGAEVVFADVEYKTGLINLSEIEKVITKKTKAIVPVHLYGQMCDMESLLEIAKKNNLYLIEDCAHCIEGNYNGYKPGQISDGAAFSFYATKNMACGEGGAIACNNDEIAAKCRVYRNHGMDSSGNDRFAGKNKKWDMIDFGLNCKMSDVQASLLIPQLSRIDELWQKKEFIALRYEEAFSKAGIRFPITREKAKNARHLFTILVDKLIRDQIVTELIENGIGCTINYLPVHLTAYYRENFGFKENMFPVAETIGAQTISIPLYPKLSDGEIEYIISKTIELSIKC